MECFIRQDDEKFNLSLHLKKNCNFSSKVREMTQIMSFQNPKYKNPNFKTKLIIVFSKNFNVHL